MRSIPVVLVLLAPACQRHDKAPKATPAPSATTTENAPTAVRQAVPTKPLPPLAAEQGGATGKALWEVGWGGLGIDAPRGLAVGKDGSVYVAGYFDGETDFGAPVGKRASAGMADGFVSKLGPDGKLQWAQTFGAKRDDTANAIAVRGDTVVVAGNFDDELKIGTFDNKSQGSDDLFVAAFDTKGNPQWLWTLGGIDSDGANAIAPTPDGGWIVGGSFSRTIELGAIKLVSKGGTDALLVKLASNGQLQWVKQFGGAYSDAILGVAADADGNIYVQGVFKDVSDWGGAPLKAGGGSDNDVVLAKYDINGDHIWSKRFGNAFNDVAGGVAVDRAGHVVMTGSFDREASFGPGDDHTSIGESDIFVARYDTDGKLDWAKTYGSEREDIGWGIATDAAGNVLVTGWFQNTVDFGKGALTSAGNKDVFALKLEPTKGETVWARSWGDHDHDQGRAAAVDPEGNPIFAGIYRFSIDLVAPPLSSARAPGDRIPKPDVFVVKLAR